MSEIKNENKQKFYFTFGSNHLDKFGRSLGSAYVKIEADSEAEARDIMFKARGPVFCTSYAEEYFTQINKDWPMFEVSLEQVTLNAVTDAKVVDVRPWDIEAILDDIENLFRVCGISKMKTNGDILLDTVYNVRQLPKQTVKIPISRARLQDALSTKSNDHKLLIFSLIIEPCQQLHIKFYEKIEIFEYADRYEILLFVF